MKCIRNTQTGVILRVTAEEAKLKVASLLYVYATKGDWKRSVRPNLTAMKAAAKDVVANMVAGKPNVRRLGGAK